MVADTEKQIALGPFLVDLAAGRLFRDGVDLELRPQAFRALKVLVQNPGRLVDYDHLIREAWDVHVSKHTLAVTVSELKNVLEEYGSWIICRPKVGYCLEIHTSEDLLRKGWHYWGQYTREGFENALLCFQEAARADSADFRAFQGIASSCLMLGGFLMRAPRDMHQPFVDAFDRAVKLCGLTPELRLDRAYGLYIFEKKLTEAESELLAVRSERPNSVNVYVRLAMVYMALGRLDEALAVMRQAEAVDALLPQLAFIGTLLRLFRHEFDSAVAWAKKTLDLHPGSQVGRVFYAEALEFSGRQAEALGQYRLASAMSPDISWIRAQAARFFAANGHRAEALEILDDLQRYRETAYVDAYHMALLQDALGDRDAAFRELKRAYDEGSYTMLSIDVDAKADSLRSDPRFARLRGPMASASQRK